MMKNVIALILSAVMTARCFGAVPVFGAEATVLRKQERNKAEVSLDHEETDNPTIIENGSEGDSKQPDEEKKNVEDKEFKNREVASEEKMVTNDEKQFRGAVNLEDFEVKETEVDEVSTLGKEGNTRDIVDYGKCGDNLSWTFDAEGILIISGTGEMNNYSQDSFLGYNNNEPEWYNGNSEAIKEVIIKNGVTTIGDYAFHGLYSLESVTVPDGIKRIGAGAFEYCAITDLILPTSITSIGNSAFWRCRKMVNISIPESVTNIGSGAFADCENLESISLPSSVQKIDNGTFNGCSNLKNIQIPESVTSIGDYAFYNCQRLNSLTIPKNVMSLGEEVFSYCSSLASVFFKGNAPTISSSVFNGVTASIYYPSNNSTWTEDVRQGFGGNIEWIEDSAQNGFYDPDDEKISTDVYQAFEEHAANRPGSSAAFVWSFPNWRAHFPDSNSGYYISREDYERLIRALPFTERVKIAGKVKSINDIVFWTKSPTCRR